MFIALSLGAFAQSGSEEIASKRAIYEETLEKIRELEEKAQYNGDDPIIRERLNIPPKLPEFEEWILQAQRKKEQQEKQNLEAQPTSSIESQVVTSGTAKQSVAVTSFSWSRKETNVILASFFSFLFMNFLIYNFIKTGRSLFVATPFDLGTRGQKNDYEKSVKWKKYLRELFLLFMMLLVIPFALEEGKNNVDESVRDAIFFGLKLYAACHIGYVIIRGIWGSSSRCPKCGTSFAFSQTASWEEARLTYQKPLSNKNVTMEKGVRHIDFRCSACGHEAQKQSQYEKQITY